MNICGVLVHASPGGIADVARSLAALDGVEVHQTGDQGQIVVTVEDTGRRPAIDTLLDIQRLNGVLAASLVYHHFETGIEDAETKSQGERP